MPSNANRSGSVYLAVLGTAMIVSVLALSALALQRVQNRMLTCSADIRQAQLNAEAAIELGMLTIKNDPSWRSSYPSGTWYSNRQLGIGNCTLKVEDPDGSLADDATDSIVLTGIGAAGSSEQRVVRTVDSVSEPLECLLSSIAAGDTISVTNGALRATNSGLISANTATASGSTVHGRVQATSVSGSTYTGTTSQITAADRPAMPNWSTVFDYYRNNGTEIVFNSLPSTTPNLGRNVNIGNGTSDWVGNPPGVDETALLSQSGSIFNALGGNSFSLRVTNRGDYYAGPTQRIDSFVKPGQDYYVEANVYYPLVSPFSRNFVFTCYTKGSGNGSPLISGGPAWPNQSAAVTPMIWKKISATVTAQAWSGDLEYAFIKIAGSDSSNTGDFYVDDFYIRETTTGRFIYRRAIGPGVNTLGGTANAQGLYWINCGGNKLVIERSRIKGTLLILNPGSGSTIGSGPISISPARPGYPSLMIHADTPVNADFTIAATNRGLSEADEGVNFNPAGMSHESLGSDGDTYDTFPSEIQGLVLVEDDLTIQNNALVRGSVFTGGDLTTSSGSLEVVYRPDALYSPPPGLSGTAKQVSRPHSVRKVVQP